MYRDSYNFFIRFLRTLTTTPALSQDGRILNLDDKVFNQLQAKFQDVLKDVKTVVGARKKGRRKSGDASNTDGMDAE